MLNNLSPLVKKKQRLGRGGKRGGTSGKGHKGQKARTGGASKIRSTFEGGQSPLVRRLPKRGFSNLKFSEKSIIINTEQLERCFDDGATIDLAALHHQGLIKTPHRVFVKMLAKGTISKKFTIHAHAFSASAQKLIEQHGGSCFVIGGAY